ncbi:unnamed protein product [Polarella glacialis]|uniref:RING-type domain-containing protein n=1 Tax=Polarella glacialis TaxID=89957 RepID=A0A813L2G6_POLGL|nr:unnamed protein product [Polarella glacialis]
MAFLPTLKQAMRDAEEARGIEQQLACHALVERFKAQCLEAANCDETSCELCDNGFFTVGSRFTHGVHTKASFQDVFVESVQTLLDEEFGHDSKGCRNATIALSGTVFSSGVAGIKMTARWPHPKPSILLKLPPCASNLCQQCCVCLECVPVVAIKPCGHLICTLCVANFPQGRRCPVCRELVSGSQNLFS